MTSHTLNYALPYPDGTNAPCDFGTDWCAFTDTTQTVLDGFAAIADRTNPVIPVARLLTTAAVTIIDGQEVPFDTVSLDTAAWVDFDADPAGITTDRAGRFFAHGFVQFSPTGTVNNLVTVKIRYTNQIQNPVDTLLDKSNGVPISPNVATFAAVTVPTRWSLVCTTQNGANMQVQLAELVVYWCADRGTP